MKRVPLLDLLRRLYPDSSPAQLYARIHCGEVLVNGERIRDPRARVPGENSAVTLQERKFVSRGGWKLDAVLAAWKMDVAGMCLIDAGCSTGGFTDCLLQRRAAHVIAVDVGYNQLDYRLRKDERVTVLERTNLLHLRREMLPRPPEAAVADLSFRSLRRAASHLLSLVSRKWLIALVKPQFEWRAPDSGFRGVVRDHGRLREILLELVADLKKEGLFVHRLARSVLPGTKGNREFFFYLADKAGGADSRLLRQLEASVLELVPR